MDDDILATLRAMRLASPSRQTDGSEDTNALAQALQLYSAQGGAPSFQGPTEGQLALANALRDYTSQQSIPAQDQDAGAGIGPHSSNATMGAPAVAPADGSDSDPNGDTPAEVADAATGLENQEASSAPTAEGGELILAADHPAHPWVTDFRNRHYANAAKLAKIIGNGATPDEILAISGNEFLWGLDPKAKEHGNYFGLHSRSIYQKDFFPGQTGTVPTSRDGPLAAFDPETGFFYSGLRFANRMKAAAGHADLSDPETFFSLAHERGWGTTQKGYLGRVMGAYATIRRSARSSDKPT